MACLLQPECNFLHSFLQVQAHGRGSGRGSEDYLYAGDTHF